MARKLTKTYPKLIGLSKFHLDVAREIDKIRPAWLGYARIGEWHGEEYMEICVPSSSKDKKLLIKTSNHEITICFDRWHGHYFVNDGIQNAVKRVFEGIQALMDEDWIVVVQARQMRVRPDRNQFKEQISFGVYTSEQIAEIPVSDLVYTCSWNDTYDKVYRNFDFPWE